MWNSDGHDERYCQRCFVFLILLFLVFANTNQLSAQQTPANKKALLTDERFAPGEVLSAGNNSLPVGTLKAKTYRLEKVKLLKPFESMESNGSRRQLESAYRVKIVLDASPDNDYFIWIDDIPLRAYTSGYLDLTGENSISVLLYGTTVPFDDGASLGISTYSRKYELTMLPEKLTVPIKFQTKHENESLSLQSHFQL
jgi:hypothetical protein